MAVGFAACATCHDAAPFCPACGGTQLHVAMLSTASRRGARWAELVVSRPPCCALDFDAWPAWPEYDASPKLRAIAARWVADLARAPEARAFLARICARAAGERYNEWRHARRRW